MPSARVANTPYSCARIKFASVNRLSGVRTNSGRPSSSPAIGSPARWLYARRPPASGSPSSASRNSVSNTASASSGAPAASANRANRPTQAASSLAPLLQCTIATGSPAGVVTRSSCVVNALQRTLEHDHREDARAGAHVAGARRDRVRRDHAGAGIALRRAQRRAGAQRSRRVQERCALGGQLPCRLAPRREPSAAARAGAALALAASASKRAAMAGVVVPRVASSMGNMPLASPDAEHSASGEPPVHVAGEGRDEANLPRRAARRRAPPGRGARSTSAAGC